MTAKHKNNAKKGLIITFVLLLILGIILSSLWWGNKDIPKTDVKQKEWPTVYEESFDSTINYDGSVSENDFCQLFEKQFKAEFNTDSIDFYSKFKINYTYSLANEIIEIKCTSNGEIVNNFKMITNSFTYDYLLDIN